MATGEESQRTPLEHTQTSNPEGTPDPNRLSVVGTGASAGGIRPLQTFFQAMPSNPGIVFVVVMHLSPDRESALPQVLQVHAAYLEYLCRTSHEARALLKDLLISVTHFFRDPAAFEALQQQVIPKLFEDKPPGGASACGWLAAPRAKRPTASPCCSWNRPMRQNRYPTSRFSPPTRMKRPWLMDAKGSILPPLRPTCPKRVCSVSLYQKAPITGYVKNCGKGFSLRRTASSRTRPFHSSTSSRVATC